MAMQVVRPDAAFTSFEVESTACDAIARLSGPIHSVAVLGDMRSGKSYLLNVLAWLFGAPMGVQHFSTDPGMETHTVGVWHLAIPKDDGGYWLLLDIEGLSAPDRPEDYDQRLFAVAVLCSSSLVFNTMGSIVSKDLVSRFQALLTLTDMIGGDDCGVGAVHNFDDFFPRLHWVLRDFYLQSNDGETAETAAERVLRGLLQPETARGPMAQHMNNIRTRLSTWFRSIDVQTLPRPVADESFLRSLQDLGMGQLRPDFLVGCRKLHGSICQGEAFHLHARPLDGRLFVEYLVEVVTRINTGHVAHADILGLMAQRSHEIAKEEATARWRRRIEAGTTSPDALPMGDKELAHLLDAAFDEARAVMTARLLVQTDTVSRDALLDTALRAEVAALHVRNREACLDLCGRLRRDSLKEVQALRGSGRFEADGASEAAAVEQAVREALCMFDESARGPPEVVAVQREDTHTLLNAVVDDVRASVLRVQRAAEETARERQHLEALAAAEAEARRQAEAQMEASRQKHAERFAEESARREREQTMLQEERQRSRQEREEQARLNAERETAERADARIVQEMWLNEQLLRHLHMQEEQHEQAWMQELKGITFQAIEHDDAKNGLLKKRYALKQKNISALARRQEESKRRRVSEQAMLTSANISLNYDLTESRELVGPERMQRLDALKTEVVEERSNMERRSVTEIGAARQCFEKLKSELLSTPDEFIDDLLCNTYWAKATGWFGEARCFSCDI